jgi:hypothetical protein
MKLNNWNSFLINENMDKAKSYMKSKGLDTSDDGFKLIRTLLQKNMGYMYKFTTFYYEESISIDDLTTLLSFLNGGDSSKLRNTLDSYIDYNTLIDEIELINTAKEVKAVYDELIPQQKSLVMKSSGSYDKKFATLAQDIYKIENKESFFKKIAKAKDYYDIIDLMTDFVTKFKSGGSYDNILNKIADFPDATEIVYQDPIDKIVICKVKRFEAGNKLGSTNWCIVNQVSSWQSYVYSSDYDISQQYYIWNFSLGISDPAYLCGVTVNSSGITYAHDFNDSSIKNNLPLHIKELLSYLAPISEDEMEEYRQIKSDERSDTARLERIATQERLANLQEENNLRRENDEWGEDNSLIMAVIEFLTVNHDLHMEELAEEGDDIYDVLFQINLDDEGKYDFEYGSIELSACTYDEAQIVARTSCENLIEEFKEDYTQLFGENTWILDGCIDEEAIIRDYERDAEEDDVDWDYVDWSDYFDEDDIRDNWEDNDIDADEDGDMDEDSFDSYIEKLKDENRDAVMEKETESINDELKEDPIAYLKMYNISMSNYVDENKLIDAMIDADGYVHQMNSYHGTVDEIYINDENYCVWRT